MKKLFRTSKPTIEPLPPPLEARSPPPPPQASNAKKSFSSLMMGGGGGDQHDYKGWGFGHAKQEVTPFPMDIGRESQTNTPPPPPPPKKKDKGGKAPTLLELQQHQQQPDRRWETPVDGWSDAPRPNGNYNPYSTTPPSGFYLPPGARPPSPPPPLRPSTPSRDPYSNSVTHSQASLHSNPNHYDVDTTPRIGRDRGYSSASNRESEEGGLTVPGMTVMKSPPPLTTRSPLGNSFHEEPDQKFPSPHPYTSNINNSASAPAPAPAHYSPPLDEPQSHAQHMRNDEEPREREKRRFWGVAWGDKKEKDKGRAEDRRAEIEEWRQSESFSGHGHDTGKRVVEVTNVDQAIQILCSSPDPQLSAIYDVCDRVNQSENPDSIAKETAKAIRKWFKHGSEKERRATSKVWLIMMRNIQVKTFRQHAGSKKFLHPLEVILTAPASKPLVTAGTYKIMTEIVADLTFLYGQEKGCDGLLDLWKKVKLPQEPDNGIPLPSNHPIFTDSRPPRSRQASEPPLPPGLAPSTAPRSKSPQPYGPGYAALPNHQDDIRRLMEESVAAKESARVLLEALVYTRPEELESKPIIKEFYRKCFLAHESLTNQMDWAQAEAQRSRENANVQRLLTSDNEQDHQHQTLEEQALNMLFEAHSNLSEGIKQHDDLEKMAMDEMEMREARERSRKETRMDRSHPGFDQNNTGLMVPDKHSGSSSRSPSPAGRGRLPHSPNHSNHGLDPISRTHSPSPELLPPIRSPSPARTASPTGRARGPRPLPNPFRTASQTNLQTLGSTQTDDESDAPTKPSRKALGKRRAVVDEDNHFDPDDMFKTDKKDSSNSSDESVTADEVYFAKPVKYAYDAYQEKLDAQKAASEGSSQSSHGNYGSRGATWQGGGGVPGAGGSSAA